MEASSGFGGGDGVSWWDNKAARPGSSCLQGGAEVGSRAPRPWEVLDSRPRFCWDLGCDEAVLQRGGPGEPYPGAIVEIEDHPRHDVVRPWEDVRLGPGCHLTVCEEHGAAGPLPPRVL